MSAFFYLLGWFVTIAAGGWTAITVNHNLTLERGGYEAAPLLGMIPGLWALGAGLLLLAIAGILRRLDRLISLTRKSLHADAPSSTRADKPSNSRQDWD